MKIFMRVMWILGLIAWSVCFALGFNYGNSSSFLITILVFIAVLVVMATDLIILHRQNDPAVVINREKARLKEIASLVVYVAMVAVTITGVARFVTVQNDIKSEVSQLAKTSIDEIYEMFTEEEGATGSYNNYVYTMATRYRASLAMTYSDAGTLDMKEADFVDRMKDYGGYRPIGIDDLIDDYDYTVLNWLPWDIAETLGELDKRPSEWAASLTELSEDVLAELWPAAIQDAYQPKITVYGPSLQSRLTQYDQSNFGLLSIILIVVIQLMIIIPYVWQKDWSLSGPKKYTGKPNKGPAVLE